MRRRGNLFRFQCIGSSGDADSHADHDPNAFGIADPHPLADADADADSHARSDAVFVPFLGNAP